MRTAFLVLAIALAALVSPRAVGGTTLGIDGTRLTIDGKATFLLGFSYYGALGASESSVRQDLDDAQRDGFNWLRVWATWNSFGQDVSAFDAVGAPRQPFMDHLKWLVAECDRRGLIVDVTLARGSVQGQSAIGGGLPDFDAHRRAVTSLVTELRPWRNWFLDLANEHDIRDFRYVSAQEISQLRACVQEIDRDRLVTASCGGHDLDEVSLRRALLTEELDFITPHRPRHAASPGETESVTRAMLETMKQIGRVVPVLHQEPFRRGFSAWEPSADDFLTDLRGAVAGGAAGWCFHNGSQRDVPDGQPRRSFDMSGRRLYDQLDPEERRMLHQLSRDRFWSRSAAHSPGAEAAAPPTGAPVRAGEPATRVSIHQGRWQINGRWTNPGSAAEGLLMNVRMVNAVFEDANKPDFDAEANMDEFIAAIPAYTAHGVNAFTICLQGGLPGYEGAVNSAFEADGALRPSYLARVEKVIGACDRAGAVVILGCFYQRQDQLLEDEAAVRRAVSNVAAWIREAGFGNVVLEITNEFGHPGFDHPLLQAAAGQAELIRLARQVHPQLLVSTSGLGDARLADEAAQAADFLLIHFNTTDLADYGRRIEALKKYEKPIVCNEDEKCGTDGARAAQRCVEHGAAWGLMEFEVNQRAPFRFQGSDDDPTVYAALRRLTTPPADGDYFPPSESQGGWRTLTDPGEIRRLAGMDPERLAELRDWLLRSDDRNFAAVVIRNGYIVLEVERGNSAKTDIGRVASVSKAVCATVLAIASEQSQSGALPRRMTFDDLAFDFIPWAQPLSDPRKARITVKQLLNHTSGLCPEALGAPNDGSWEYVLGLSGDPRTAQLAFDPGTGCGYSTHGPCHAALVCETVTGRPYDEFAVEALFKPIGCEHWWFQYYDGGPRIGRHPSHAIGMPARDLARIGYCLLHNGRWGGRQIVPQWFIDQTAQPTHDVETRELRWQFNPQIFSHGWELPARLAGDNTEHWRGDGIPPDARSKFGSGGQLLAFVPSLQLVIARQTGSAGGWDYVGYLRRACAAALTQQPMESPSDGERAPAP